MNLYTRNFIRKVVQLGNYYSVVNIAMLCYLCSIYVVVKLWSSMYYDAWLERIKLYFIYIRLGV